MSVLRGDFAMYDVDMDHKIQRCNPIPWYMVPHERMPLVDLVDIIAAAPGRVEEKVEG